MRALLSLLIVTTLTGAAEADTRLPHCFMQSQMDGWRAADGKTVYIRANVSRYYRLDLSRECTILTEPDAHLILRTFGVSLICSATDFRLSAGQSGPAGFVEPCFMKKLTELSPEEAAALPRKVRP